MTRVLREALAAVAIWCMVVGAFVTILVAIKSLGL